MNILALDIGTSTLSAIVLDAQSGTILETINQPNDAAFSTGDEWAHCQDPDRICAHALALISELRRRHSPVASIGLTGQMHGILYLNAQGRALSPLYTWQDERGNQPYDENETYVHRLMRLSGHTLCTGFGSVTHYWHQHHGTIPDGAVRFCAIHDYVGMRMTGRTRPLTHVSNAASFGLYDFKRANFDQAAIEAAGMDARFFPMVSAVPALLGYDAQGIPVAVGIGDNQASFLGSVRESTRSVLVNMGTGGQVSMMARATRPLPGDIEARPLSGTDQILVGSSLCGGRAYAILENFLRACAQLNGQTCQPLYEVMNTLGDHALDLDDRLQVNTAFSGTRQNPALRGRIAGLSEYNFTPEHLIGGVLEGMAEELYAFYRQMQASGAGQPEILVGSGNALRKNPALRKAFERRFAMPMLLPAHREEAAFGAALFAMASAGLVSSLEQAQRLVRYES